MHATTGQSAGNGPAPSDPRPEDRRTARRSALLIAFAVCAALAAGVFGLWFSATSTMRANYQRYLISLAEAAALQVDPDLHAQLRDPGQLNGPLYLKAILPLLRMRAAMGDVHFVYTAVRDGDRVRFVLDATSPGDNDADGVEDQAGIWEEYEDADPAMLRALGDGVRHGEAGVTEQPSTDKWGTFMSAYSPIYDRDGRQIGIVGIDVDAATFQSRMTAARRWAVLGLAPAVLLIAVLGVGHYRSRLRSLVDERHLRENAQRDRLTGLANRSLFMDRLQAALQRVRERQQPLFAVLFLDFDRFKLVNDTLGHAAGDELLRQIAGRLRAALRANDLQFHAPAGNIIARFGGDEFVVLLNDLAQIRDAIGIGERLLTALAPIYSIRDSDVHSSASIGIVTSDTGTEDAEAIVRNADVAMYEAKHAGRNCCVVFNDGMHQRLSRNVSIEAGLRRALGTSELELVYQPIVELETGRVVSAESLARWRSATLGEVKPSEFIPVAEESGLIVPLGQWVMAEACAMLARWRHEDPASAPLSISVNVSRAELATGERLLASVRATLGATGLPPHCLQLEITERETMRDAAATRQIMQQLIAMGVTLAMDDFGTGSSSLACLRDFPFQTIKIDRSFVSDLATDHDVLAVIHATITLIGNLAKHSVAEGVENAAQVAILQSLGCRFAQGYHFYRPAAESQLRAMLSSSDQQSQLARRA